MAPLQSGRTLAIDEWSGRNARIGATEITDKRCPSRVKMTRVSRWRQDERKIEWLGRWDWCSSSVRTESKHPRFNVHRPVSPWYEVVGFVRPPSVTPTPHCVRLLQLLLMVGRKTVAPSTAARGGWQGWNCTAIAASRPDNCCAAYGAPPTAIFRAALTTFRLAMQYSFTMVLGATYYARIWSRIRQNAVSLTHGVQLYRGIGGYYGRDKSRAAYHSDNR